MSNLPDPADSSAPATGDGPLRDYVHVTGIIIIAAYLVVLLSLSLYSVVKLWPHPTPAGERPTAETTATETTGTETTGTSASAAKKLIPGQIPPPKEPAITQRKNMLCKGDTECQDCIQREMQLQFESQRENDPQCTYVFGHDFLIWQEERLLLLVFLAGAIGAMLHALRSMIAFIGNRRFVRSWLTFYYLSPFAGASLAFISYVVIRGGFFSSTSTTKDTNPFTFVALGAFSGLFSQQVLEKLKKVAESAFDKPDTQRDTLGTTTPVIDALDPDTVAANRTDPIVVTGQNFAKGAGVTVGGKNAPTNWDSDKRLSFTLPAAMTPGTVDVVVKNPDPHGTSSLPKKLTIT